MGVDSEKTAATAMAMPTSSKATISHRSGTRPAFERNEGIVSTKSER